MRDSQPRPVDPRDPLRGGPRAALLRSREEGRTRPTTKSWWQRSAYWFTTALLLVLGCATPPEGAISRPPQRLEPRIDVDVDDEDLAVVMGHLAARAGRAVLVDPSVQERVTVDLRGVPWREAVDVIARLCRCDVEERAGGVLVLTQPQRVTVQVDAMSATGVVRLVADHAGLRVVFAGAEPTGSVDGTFEGRARDVIAAVLAEVGEFDVLEEDDGQTLRVVARRRR